MKRQNHHCFSSLAALVALISWNTDTLGQYQYFTWNRDANDTWQNAGNWNPSSAFPNASNQAAFFGNVITANRTITGSNLEVGVLEINKSVASSYSFGLNNLTVSYINNYGSSNSGATFLSGNIISPGDLVVNNGSTAASQLRFEGPGSIASQSNGKLIVNNTNNGSNVTTIFKGLSNISQFQSNGGVTIYYGSNNFSAGDMRVNSGVLSLDYTYGIDHKMSEGTNVDIQNGFFHIQNLTTTYITDQLHDFNIFPGANTIQIEYGRTELVAGNAIRANAINRPEGTGLNIILKGSTGNSGWGDRTSLEIQSWDAGSANYLLNRRAFASVGQNTFAIVREKILNPLVHVVDGAPDSWYDGNTFNTVYSLGLGFHTANTDISSSTSTPSNPASTVLRLANSAVVTVAGTWDITSGGILCREQPLSTNSPTIQGGSLATTEGEFLFHVHGSGTLTVSSQLTGAAALTKFGPGRLSLVGSTPNTNTGTAYVTEGTLFLNKSSGVNAIGGNLVLNGGTVVVSSNNLPDSCRVSQYGGSLSLGAETLGSYFFGSGGLSLSGPLTFTSSDQFALDMNSTNFNGGSWSFVGATGGGIRFNSSGTGGTNFTNMAVNLGGRAREMNVLGSYAWLQGTTITNGGITKTGSGTLYLSGSLTYSGDTVVNEGSVYFLNGMNLSQSTIRAGSTGPNSVGVSGNGITFINSVVSTNDAMYLAPNGNMTLNTLDMSNGGMILAQITSSSTYDHLLVNGMNIFGSTTQLYLGQAATFNANLGDIFFLITRGSGSSGEFAGLPEGMVFSPGNRIGEVYYQISYHGGDGNDIVLTAVAVPELSSWIMLGLASLAIPGYYQYRRAQNRRIQSHDLDFLLRHE